MGRREAVFQLRRLARDRQPFPLSKCVSVLTNIIAAHESKVKDIVLEDSVTSGLPVGWALPTSGEF